MLIGLINKSLAIYGHHAPLAFQLKKWRAGETVWDGFTRVGRPCLEISCKEVKVAWASCRRYSSELLRSSRFCSSLSTAFSLPSQIETAALLVSVNGVHNCSAWLRSFLVCKQLFKIMTFILSRFFRSFISTSTNSPHSLSQRCNETVPCTCIPNVSSTRSLLVDLSVTSVTFLTSLNSTKTTILSWKVKVHGYS